MSLLTPRFGPSLLATPESQTPLLSLPLQELFENAFFCQEQNPVRALQTG
jgi:hypothetical protein